MSSRSCTPVSGRTYTMYHGTSTRVAEQIRQKGFRPSADGMLGPGVYLSRDQDKTLYYAHKAAEDDGSSPCIIEVRVNVGKVKKIDRQGHPLQYTWMKKGYDSAWVPEGCGMVDSERTENCIANPRRITFVKIHRLDHDDEEDSEEEVVAVQVLEVVQF